MISVTMLIILLFSALLPVSNKCDVMNIIR